MRLYLVADEIHFRRGVAEERIVRAVEGGVEWVQLREKHCSNAEFVQLARRILAAVRIPVIINDRIEVAREAGAQGVHLGQSDDPPELARTILGPDAIIGLSVEREDQAARAATRAVNYLGVSAVFASHTKNDLKRIWGLEGLRALRAITSLPLVGIGGITEDNAASVIEAGADGIAVISTFSAREDWKTKAERLRQRIDRAKERAS